MQLPKRDPKHVTETKSFKIFSRNIPDNWIIREVSERDYGIDCYIELVDNNDQVTGELISIQLKGIRTIKWTKSDHYTFSGIKISTTNYWMKFPTPVFICLVDVDSEEVFFTPVKSTVRKNFYSYIKQDDFSYKVHKKDSLSQLSLEAFLISYFTEKSWKSLELNINSFLSNCHRYKEFIEENIGRDYFMGVDIGRVMYLKVFFENIRFLCLHFQIEWKLKPINEYFKESQKAFGDHYDIHEHYIELIVKQLEEYLSLLALKIKDHVSIDEEEYWHAKDSQLFNLVINIDNEGNIPEFI
ncbi:DUF4365 domain-containing protein [Pseudoalteromonas sp. M8]|uniref:DUF4365 domain-containing protein n=1 Tax=Pseudoalteromonas sp. M8 TaxID=2692624 RepID=UPI001BAC1932|nr:DUF4365 domain-containing protein [Pseudoalteromonas sp. M8]QUI71425.1 DUF4365 domain-containing protein [Pseudoalteromonas sp. M8]